MPSKPRDVVVVGLGGIGSWLLRGLCPYLAHPPSPSEEVAESFSGELVLVDGDDYDTGNAGRQLFDARDNKAEVSAAYADGFGLMTRAVTTYLGAETRLDGPHPSSAIGSVIGEGSEVFLCVDNHATRRLVLAHAASLRDVEVYSAGNEYEDGNVVLYLRASGRDLTPNPLSYHPDLMAEGKRPDEMSCEEMARSGSPQLICANMMAATLLLSMYHLRRTGQYPLGRPEVFFDCRQLATVARERKLKGKPQSKSEPVTG